MHKKYFFFDIDQTLGLGISQQVPPDTQYCWMPSSAGHFVALATGRIQCDAAAFAQKHGISSMVADGGSSLTVDGKILSMEGLPLEPARALLRDLTRRQQPGRWWWITPWTGIRPTRITPGKTLETT